MMTTTTNKEALLVLYLAEELSPGERAEVERMIASDEPMRQMLDELRAAQTSLGAALARLDETQPMPQAEVAAVARRTARSIQQWHVEQLARQGGPPMVSSHPRRGLAGWRGYALAAAVAILGIGLYVYWGQQGVTSTPGIETAERPDWNFEDWRNLETPIDPSNPADREAAELAAAFDPRPTQFESLSNLEQEINKLNELAALGRLESGTQ
jgi:anti-sigma factor RsiW